MPRGKKSKRNYFTQETEDAIVKYNNTSDPEIRSKIYEKEIHYAFFKLTQNIIHTFKFYHTEVSNLEHLQHEIETFLLSKMHLFDQSKGAKAFSYFGTIVKRWLILYNTKNYNKKIKKVPEETLLKEKYNHSYTIDNYGKTKDDLSNYISFGASPRASINLSLASKANAFLSNRDYVMPDDIKEVANDVLNHRIILNYEAEAEGVRPDSIIRKILEKVEINS